MATATEIYRVTLEPCEDGHNWHVVDENGDIYESFKTRAEAKADATERNVEAEVESLREDISDALDDMDLETLRKMAALIKRS